MPLIVNCVQIKQRYYLFFSFCLYKIKKTDSRFNEKTINFLLKYIKNEHFSH
jgi:hypothetical protein